MHEYDRVRICFHRMTFGLTSKYSIFCYDKLQTDCLTRYKNIHWIGWLFNCDEVQKSEQEKNVWKSNFHFAWNINSVKCVYKCIDHIECLTKWCSLPCLSRAYTVTRLQFCKYSKRCSLLFTSRRHFPSIESKKKNCVLFFFQLCSPMLPVYTHRIFAAAYIDGTREFATSSRPESRHNQNEIMF